MVRQTKNFAVILLTKVLKQRTCPYEQVLCCLVIVDKLPKMRQHRWMKQN